MGGLVWRVHQEHETNIQELQTKANALDDRMSRCLDLLETSVSQMGSVSTAAVTGSSKVRKKKLWLLQSALYAGECLESWYGSTLVFFC